eukprot:2824736-Alexandrium_andersonii.AAC.1
MVAATLSAGCSKSNISGSGLVTSWGGTTDEPTLAKLGSGTNAQLDEGAVEARPQGGSVLSKA